jgi:HAD superfamily hydrolase (TIGR01509 family)
MSHDVRAVLFDMDGTLVETEEYWGEALFALARRYGGRLSEAGRRKTIGSSMRVSMDVLDADLGLRRSEEQRAEDGRWVEETTARLMAAGGISWRPGAAAVVSAVRAAGLTTALVTTTPRSLAETVLESIRADLGEDPFDVTLCGDEVPARKPDPTPYRQAMAALAVDPAQCVVIEDSTAGVTSGLAAGAAVLGVPSLQPLAPAPGLTLRDSLDGVGVRELQAVLVARTLADSRA